MAPAERCIDPSLPIESIVVDVTSTPMSNDTADAIVRDLILAHRDGHYTEDETRHAILELMFLQSVHSKAVDQYGVPTSEREEIIGAVVEDMSKVFLKDDGTGFNLDMALDKSTCSFVRHRARYTAMSKMRDARRAEARDGTPSDPTAIAFTSAASYEDPAFVSTVDIDRHYQAVEDFSTIAQNVRGLTRVRVGAQHAYNFYKVNLAVRPTDIAERDRVWNLIHADRSLPYRSLRAFYASIHDRDPRPAQSVPDEVLALWLDMDVEMLEQLIEADPAYAYAIAVDAVGPWARPSQRNIQRFRAQLATLRKGDLEWRSLTAALVSAFVDHEFQAVSDFVSVTVEKREALRKGHTINRARFESILGRVARYDTHPLGATPNDVHRSLFRAAAASLGSPELTRFADQSVEAA